MARKQTAIGASPPATAPYASSRPGQTSCSGHSGTDRSVEKVEQESMRIGTCRARGTQGHACLIGQACHPMLPHGRGSDGTTEPWLRRRCSFQACHPGAASAGNSRPYGVLVRTRLVSQARRISPCLRASVVPLTMSPREWLRRTSTRSRSVRECWWPHPGGR